MKYAFFKWRLHNRKNDIKHFQKKKTAEQGLTFFIQSKGLIRAYLTRLLIGYQGESINFCTRGYLHHFFPNFPPKSVTFEDTSNYVQRFSGRFSKNNFISGKLQTLSYYSHYNYSSSHSKFITHLFPIQAFSSSNLFF